MLHPADEILKNPAFSIALRLNSQQRELLQRAVVAEGLPSIDALVRMAIFQTAQAAEKSNV